MPTPNNPSVASLKRAIAIAEQIESLQSQLASIVGGGAAAKVVTKAVATPAAPTRKGRRGRRTMSAEARERIAAAQRARWAKSKGGSSAKASAPAPAAKSGKKKRAGLTAEGRARL